MIKPYLMDFNDCKIALEIQPYSCLQNGFLHSHSYKSFYVSIYEFFIKKGSINLFEYIIF
jgi:hypothetical protein